MSEATTGYSYELMKYSASAGEYVQVGTPTEFATLAELQTAVKADLGYVPGWLLYVSPTTYLQEESDEDGGYTLVIEGQEQVP